MCGSTIQCLDGVYWVDRINIISGIELQLDPERYQSQANAVFKGNGQNNRLVSPSLGLLLPLPI